MLAITSLKILVLGEQHCDLNSKKKTKKARKWKEPEIMNTNKRPERKMKSQMQQPHLEERCQYVYDNQLLCCIYFMSGFA